MANIFLSDQQQEVVVFQSWKTLPYPIRLAVSYGGILAGLVIQYLYYPTHPNPLFPEEWYGVMVGLVLILIGNRFLFVRGFDNRVNFGAYSPASAWERVDRAKVREIEELIKQMKKWDRSWLDVSNRLGCFPVFAILAGVVLVGIYALAEENAVALILALDAAVLLVPHWFTGQRSIITQPNLVMKTKLIEKLLQDVDGLLDQHQTEYFMLLQGGKVPEDVKFRVKLRGQHPDFLGFYGQIVTNDVSGTSYPYFYVVLVAKQGYGLQKHFNGYTPSKNITKEFKPQGDVEVFVIRQTTTKTSGYHTKDKDIRRIFLEGLEVAEKAAVKA